MKEDESLKKLDQMYKKKQKIYFIKNAAILSTLLTGSSIVNFVVKKCAFLRDILKHLC